jgi:glucokinase
MTEAVLAVDLGGTRLRAAIVDADGAVHERRSQPTPQDTSCPDAVLTRTAEVLRSRPVREGEGKRLAQADPDGVRLRACKGIR